MGRGAAIQPVLQRCFARLGQGVALSGTVRLEYKGLDPLRLGQFREQSTRKVLSANCSRQEAAADGTRNLGSVVGCIGLVLGRSAEASS